MTKTTATAKTDFSGRIFIGDVRMDSKGRVLIPKRAMKALGLSAPMTLTALVDESGDIVLRPIRE